MSIKETTFYTIGCDHIGCPLTIIDAAYDDGEWVPTADEAAEVWREYADELGWKRTTNGRWHYCPEHAPIHDDDTGGDTRPIEDPTPPPPFLFDEGEVVS